MGAYDRDFEKVKDALENEADIDNKGVWGSTALLHACDHKPSAKIALYLIEKGADVNKSGGSNNDTPLTNASMYGSVEIVKALLEAGANVNKKGGYGRTPLHFVAS